MPEAFSTFPGDEWETAAPQTLALNEEKLAAAGDMLARPGSNAAAFLVVRRGKIAWEVSSQ